MKNTFQSLLDEAKNDIFAAATQAAQQEKYQQELNKIIQNHINDFRKALEKGNIPAMKPFLLTLKQGNAFSHLTKSVLPNYLINSYSLEVMKEIFPCLTEVQFKQWKSLQFMPSADNVMNSFATRQFSHNTDKLQWLLIEHPKLFKDTYEQQVFKYWGNIYFEPDKHAALNDYVLKHHPQVSNILYNASLYESEMEMDVLAYFAEKIPDLSINKDCQKLMESTVIGANIKGFKFWTEHGVTWEPTAQIYSGLISQSSKKQGFWDMIEMIHEHYDIYAFNHQIFRSALHHITDQGERRWNDCIRLLDMYEMEKIPEVIELIDKKMQKMVKEKRNITPYENMKSTAEAIYLHRKLDRDMSGTTIRSRMKI